MFRFIWLVLNKVLIIISCLVVLSCGKSNESVLDGEEIIYDIAELNVREPINNAPTRSGISDEDYKKYLVLLKEENKDKKIEAVYELENATSPEQISEIIPLLHNISQNNKEDMYVRIGAVSTIFEIGRRG